MNVMQPPIFFQKEFQKYIYILLRVIVLLFEMLTHNTAVLLVIILDKLICVLNHELLRGLASGLVLVQPDLFGPAGSKKYQTRTLLAMMVEPQNFRLFGTNFLRAGSWMV